jgi:CheY-like chemotaxis protein
MDAHPQHPGPCIVEVVDDDDDIREGLRELLEDEGYTVRTAADGREALEQMTAHRPCVLLLDLMMPKMNGWQVVQEMRARKLEVPVCVVTAMRQNAPEDVLCVLPKPVDIARLLSVVGGCAAKAG